MQMDEGGAVRVALSLVQTLIHFEELDNALDPPAQGPALCPREAAPPPPEIASTPLYHLVKGSVQLLRGRPSTPPALLTALHPASPARHGPLPGAASSVSCRGRARDAKAQRRLLQVWYVCVELCV